MSTELDSSSNNSNSPDASSRRSFRLPGQRRARKACDRCNQLRAKCDGGQPCNRCMQAQAMCEFARVMKKRGKPSKVELARRAAQKAADVEARLLQRSTAATSPGNPSSESPVMPHESTDLSDPALFHQYSADPVHLPGSEIQNGYSDLRDLPSLDQVLPQALIKPGYAPHAEPTQGHAMNIDQGLRSAQPHTAHVRYPVLLPLVPYLTSVVSLSFAGELLEYYFSSSSTVYPHPQSPYVIAFIFSKHFFLSPDPPRPYSPALLASMLWIASRTSDAIYFDESPAAREIISRKLLNLTIRLLKPLLQGSISKSLFGHGVDGPDAKGAAPDQKQQQVRGATEKLDAIVTCMHIGTVVSASEYKSASVRWWDAAWELAVRQQLFREVAPDELLLASVDDGVRDQVVREERRRVWWLLFLIDRHLSFCYNKTLALSDRECRDLLQPADEYKWQHGELFDTAVSDPSQPVTMTRPRQRGPRIEFCGAYLFGYYLPLMVILGKVVELIQARNQQRLGQNAVFASFWDEQVRTINISLAAFEQSMRTFEVESSELAQHAQHVLYDRRPSSSSAGADAPDTLARRAMHTQVQQRKALAYSKYVVHVLHNLLVGKCDPISLYDDQDAWISSPSFVEATGHAIQAADAITEILELDPDMGTIPWLFGIELLHGSFLLLLIIDKLKTDAAPDVVNAGETMVRAHEACAFTLSTEYQRKFRRVMRSAIAEARGYVLDEAGDEEEQKRRREVLSLYRWNSDGTGLAL